MALISTYVCVTLVWWKVYRNINLDKTRITDYS